EHEWSLVLSHSRPTAALVVPDLVVPDLVVPNGAELHRSRVHRAVLEASPRRIGAWNGRKGEADWGQPGGTLSDIVPPDSLQHPTWRSFVIFLQRALPSSSPFTGR